jgi:chromosome segregation ATPase
MGERDDAPRASRGRVPDLDNFERLERLVRDLVERHVALRREYTSLRHSLNEREARLRSLDARVRELNQIRQDAVKRIDDLVAQLGRVEEQLERRLSAAEAS